MNVYVGLDVSLRSVAICVVDLMGTIIEEVSLNCEVEAIADYIRSTGYQVERIGFEAAPVAVQRP